jgi:hypothetical protein
MVLPRMSERPLRYANFFSALSKVHISNRYEGRDGIITKIPNDHRA